MAALCIMSRVNGFKQSSVQISILSFLNGNNVVNRISQNFKYSTEPSEQKLTVVEDEFRQLQLRKKLQPRKPREKLRVNMLPPRYTRMPIDQVWSDVWPTAQTFKPSVVPFPVRQGYANNDAPPDKFGNLELMKIPNFLHLTPPAIKKHCAALKNFCTEWPKELDSDEKCEKYFPVEIISSDYCHSGPDIRDPRSRIVCLKIKLNKLKLNERAKDKLLRLVGAQYDQTTDYIILTAERCPLKRQNYDYVHYLLTALYHESLKLEPWEAEKLEEDMEKYIWIKCASAKLMFTKIEKYFSTDDKPKWLVDWISRNNLNSISDVQVDDMLNVSEVKDYSDAITKIHNEVENEETLTAYKESVKKLVGLSEKPLE